MNRKERIAIRAAVIFLAAAIIITVLALNSRVNKLEDALIEVATLTCEPAPMRHTALTEKTATNRLQRVEELGEFKLTAYCTCAKCCGKWADGVTATGTTATAGRTIAVDPDVIPLGSTVYINGTAYTAEDIGGAIKEKRIDILMPSHAAALEFGVQYANVSILKTIGG